MKKLVAVFLMLVMCLMTISALGDGVYAGQRVRVVIGSGSTSGDTYLATETVCRYLAKYLNADIKVDAVGASAAFDTMKKAAPDGLTIMGFHDQTYLSVLFGTYDESYDLDSYVIGPRYAQNPASAFMARYDAPYNDLKEMAEYMKANPDQVVRVAIEDGAVSHVCFAAIYAWVVEAYGEDVANQFRVVLSGSTSDKLEKVWGNIIDLPFLDYNSRQYCGEEVDATMRLKFVAVLEDIPGVEEKLPYAYECGVTLGDSPLHFSKDFVFYLPSGTPQNVLDELDAAMAKVNEDPEFKADMDKLFYVCNFLPSKDAAEYIYNKRDTLKVIIDSMPSLDDLM